jgi:hypothetical protein
VNEFSYLDLYATEGFSFLLVVGYLVLLVVFARLLFFGGKKKTHGPTRDRHTG